MSLSPSELITFKEASKGQAIEIKFLSQTPFKCPIYIALHQAGFKFTQGATIRRKRGVYLVEDFVVMKALKAEHGGPTVLPAFNSDQALPLIFKTGSDFEDDKSKTTFYKQYLDASRPQVEDYHV